MRNVSIQGTLSRVCGAEAGRAPAQSVGPVNTRRREVRAQDVTQFRKRIASFVKSVWSVCGNWVTLRPSSSTRVLPRTMGRLVGAPMPHRERTRRGNFRAPRACAWLGLAAMLTAGCSGGSSGTGATTPTPTPTKQPTAATILNADAGAVCETLLKGQAYTSTPPTLACNHGTDPYTAYLDGSKSASSGGEALSYAWEFVSKPTGSIATLSNATTANPTFVPDKAGAYTVQLVVSAGGFSSSRAVALVVALDDAALDPNLVANAAATAYHFHGGLSSDCVQCHSPASTDPTIQVKPATHIASSNACQTCHSPLGFNVTGFVDHTEVFGACSSCHDGVTATGKSQSHIATTQECSDCHNTTSFVKLNADGTFDHTGITGGCSTCHNGTVAIGTAADTSPSGHPSISVECNACHTTATFATPFPNHNDPKVVVPGTCGQAGCHDGRSVMASGVPITGKNSAPNPHPSTGNITQACDVCHNTSSYAMGGVFDHGVLARHPIACASCHDGLSATGKIAGHIPTAPGADCSNCHNTSTFVGGFVDHTSSDVTSKQCTDCHDGTHTWSFVDSTGATVTLPIPGTPTMPPVLVNIHTSAAGQSCGSCHAAGGSFALATVDHSGFGTVGNITLPSQYTGCAECHDGTVATGQNTGHLPTTQDCGTCHDPQRGDWLGAGFNHSSLSIVGNASTPTCTSCHDGSAATGRSTTHVPLPATAQDCLVCHGTSFTSFSLPTFDHAAAGITKSCASCHDGKAHDAVTVISKPAGHIPTSSDCSQCHSDTNNGPGINGTIVSGFTKATPFVSTLHPAYTTGCRSCHNASYDNATYGARNHPGDAVHTTVDANGWECNACHTTTGNFAETNPVNHQDPAVKTQQCVTCHVAGSTVEPIGKGPMHPATSDQCQQCHQAGGSFTAGFDHATLKAGGTNQGLACSTCHDGVTATGKTANHVPSTRDCVICHATYPPTASSFAGGTFDHSGPEMTGKQCMSCHDGVIATGKTPTHVATNQDCAACHNTTSFAGATGFDHTGVTSGCQKSGCHASGTPGVVDVTDDPNKLPHIPIVNASTEVDCYNCHKTPGGTFANASMSHAVVTFEACEACHDGKHDGANTAHIATPKSATHFVTTVTSCAACHASTTAWTPVTAVTYKHLPNPPGYIPTSPAATGNHSTTKVTKCVQCHTDTKLGTATIAGNADISTFPSATYGSTCAVCHLSQYKSGHGGTPPANKQNCAQSGCHRISSNSF